MKQFLFALSLLASPWLCCGGELANRWVYVSDYLPNDAAAQRVIEIVNTASAGGLNGMVWDAGFGDLSRKPPEFFARLNRVKCACRTNNLEIIPVIFSVGHGNQILQYDPNLAEGLPVRDALFEVLTNMQVVEAVPPPGFCNGSLEAFDGHTAEGYQVQDSPGRETFRDTNVFHAGTASLRIETPPGIHDGQQRLMQEIAVAPFHAYQVSCWVKTQALDPIEAFQIKVLSTDKHELSADVNLLPVAENGWRRAVVGFNSLKYDAVRIYAGTWEAKSGTIWVDDITVESAGFLNLLRRPGTPLHVVNERTGVEYKEGRDFEPLLDASLNGRFDHSGPILHLLPSTSIKSGDRLRISYYHSLAVDDGQISLCMSEPRLYETLAMQASNLVRRLDGNKFFLGMDEIREGGTCQACTARKTTMGRILGDCVSQECAILKQLKPKAEIFIWSDMLDPNHNAHAGYFLVDGDFSEAWNHIPKDLTMVCWGYTRRNQSVAHFSRLGFHVMGATYYDSDDLGSSRDWLRTLHACKTSSGIMYTTWRQNYTLLPAFCNLIRPRAAQ